MDNEIISFLTLVLIVLIPYGIYLLYKKYFERPLIQNNDLKTDRSSWLSAEAIVLRFENVKDEGAAAEIKAHLANSMEFAAFQIKPQRCVVQFIHPNLNKPIIAKIQPGKEKMNVGDSVNIIFNPHNPEEACVK